MKLQTQTHYETQFFIICLNLPLIVLDIGKTLKYKKRFYCYMNADYMNLIVVSVWLYAACAEAFKAKN